MSIVFTDTILEKYNEELELAFFAKLCKFYNLQINLVSRPATDSVIHWLASPEILVDKQFIGKEEPVFVVSYKTTQMVSFSEPLTIDGTTCSGYIVNVHVYQSFNANYINKIEGSIQNYFANLFGKVVLKTLNEWESETVKTLTLDEAKSDLTTFGNNFLITYKNRYEK